MMEDFVNFKILLDNENCSQKELKLSILDDINPMIFKLESDAYQWFQRLNDIEVLQNLEFEPNSTTQKLINWIIGTYQ